MGLRDKVALVLTTLAIAQITTTQCIPSGSRIAALQRHLDARGIKSTQSLFDNVAKVTKTTSPKRSMYKAFNFPETEYPVDSSPRDPFYYGTHLDPLVLAEHEASNQNFKAFNDMKKDMRMKRKLNMINENYQTDYEPIWTKDKALFPEVEYPLKSMDTWVPFYGNPSMPTQNDPRRKLSESLYQKSKLTSEPHKEDLKLKTKLLLDEINKIKEKISNSRVHSKSETDPKETTKDFPTPTENLIKPDTNATQISFVTYETSPYQTNFLNDERVENCEAEELLKPLDTANGTNVDEPPINLNNDSDNSSVTSIPRNKEVSKFDEPESTNTSVSTDNTKDNFQQVVTDALIELILKQISSKNNNKNQALDLNNIDTRISRDSGAKSAPVEDVIAVGQAANLLPNEAQKQQNIESMPNDDPLNVKLLFPVSSKDESVPIKNDTQMSDVNKAPCSSIIVIPVSDSINKIQLPIVETTTGTPIIVFIPTTQHSNISNSGSPSMNVSYAVPIISEAESNDSFGNLPNVSYFDHPSQTDNVLSDLHVQQTEIPCTSLEATSVEPDHTALHSTPDELTSMIDLESSEDNPSSVSLDHQSPNLFEPYPNTSDDKISSDENIIAMDKLPVTDEVLAKLTLLDDDTDNDANSSKSKNDIDIKQKSEVSQNVRDKVISVNAPNDINKEADIPSRKASLSLVASEYQLPNQEISNIETTTGISELPVYFEREEAISNIFANEENKLTEMQDKYAVKKNPIVLDNILNEVDNEVQSDAPLEDRNIKGRSLSDSTNKSVMKNTVESKSLKDISKDTHIQMKDNLRSATSESRLSESNMNNNDSQLISHDSISTDRIIELVTKDVQKATVVKEERYDASYEPEDSSLTDRDNNSLVLNDLTDDKNYDYTDENENDLSLTKDTDLIINPFNITKDPLKLPKGMLICSGITEVPCNVNNESLLHNDTTSSQAIKPNDAAVDNNRSCENVPSIQKKVLQENPFSKNEPEMKKKDVSDINETSLDLLQTPGITEPAELLPLHDKTADNHNLKDNESTKDPTPKHIKDIPTCLNKTEYTAPNVELNQTVEEISPPHNIVDNNTLLSGGVNNTTLAKDKKQSKANSKKSFKESPNAIPSETINESKSLTIASDKTNTHFIEYNKLLEEDKKCLENLSSDSKVIDDIPSQSKKSAESIETGAELSNLLKILYAAV